MFEYSANPRVQEAIRQAQRDRAEYIAALVRRFFRAILPRRRRSADA